MAIVALGSGSMAWPSRRRPHHGTKNRKEEVMNADALIRLILLGNRSLEEFAVLLARISLGVFFAISGGNKRFVAGVRLRLPAHHRAALELVLRGPPHRHDCRNHHC